MPILELKLQATYFNQECINVFAYQASGTPAAVTFSFALASAFGCIPDAGVYPSGTPFANIRAPQSSGVNYDLVSVRDLYSVTDFYETPFNPAVTGSAGASTGVSPATAYGFRSSRVRSDIRRGTKRFVGVVEGAIAAGGLIDATQNANMAAIAASLGEVLLYDDEGNTLTFNPVILGRQRYNSNTHLPDPAGNAYRYYPTEIEQAANLASGVSWDMYNQTRTQTSRQYGRGR